MTDQPPKSDKPENQRAAGRADVHYEVSIRRTAAKKSIVELLDLSRTGCKIEVPVTLQVGEKLWFTLPGMEPLQATVVWMRDWQAGLEFASPIHQSVMEHHVARLKSRPAKS